MLIAASGLTAADSDRQLDGLSLLPWIKKPTTEKKRPAITTIYAHNHSLCDTRYRYTRYADGSEELYNRQSDPHEFDAFVGISDQLQPAFQSQFNLPVGWL